MMAFLISGRIIPILKQYIKRQGAQDTCLIGFFTQPVFNVAKSNRHVVPPFFSTTANEDLVSRVRQCGIIQAAREISRLIGLTPTAPAREKTGRCCPPDMMQKVEALLATCSRGSSDYLLRKGLDKLVFLMPANSAKNIAGVHFSADSIVLSLVNPSGMIVLDTLARCFGGSDENAAKDMGAFIQGCDHIKAETGATVLVIHHSGKDLDKGARGSSAFRAALDVEFNVRREGEGGALVLSCTKMKDSEEPTTRAYDLSPLNLYIDNDGEEVNSLVVCDQGREVRDEDTPYDAELAGVQRLTANHIALWQSIRSRTASGDGCTKSLVRDDMRAMGFDVSKKFTRWLDKLETEGLISIDGEHICPDSLGNKPRN